MLLKGKRQVSKIRKPLRSWVQIIPHGPFLPAIEQGISLSPISDVSSVLCSSMNLVAMPKCSTGISTPIFREYRSHNSSSFEQIQCHDRGDEDNNESASSGDDSLLVAIIVPSDWSNFAKQTKARLDIGIAFPS